LVLLVTTTAFEGEPVTHVSPTGISELRHFVDTVVVTVPIPEK
jgi:cell division GTPase FtsZ